MTKHHTLKVILSLTMMTVITSNCFVVQAWSTEEDKLERPWASVGGTIEAQGELQQKNSSSSTKEQAEDTQAEKSDLENLLSLNREEPKLSDADKLRYKEYLDNEKYEVFDYVVTAPEWDRYIDSGYDCSVIRRHFQKSNTRAIRINSWMVENRSVATDYSELPESMLPELEAAAKYMQGIWDVKGFTNQPQTVLMQSLLVAKQDSRNISNGSLHSNFITQPVGSNSILVKTDNTPWIADCELTINIKDLLHGQGFKYGNFDLPGSIKTTHLIAPSMRAGAQLPVFQDNELITVVLNKDSKSDFLFVGTKVAKVAYPIEDNG